MPKAWMKEFQDLMEEAIKKYKVPDAPAMPVVSTVERRPRSGKSCSCGTAAMVGKRNKHTNHKNNAKTGEKIGAKIKELRAKVAEKIVESSLGFFLF